MEECWYFTFSYTVLVIYHQVSKIRTLINDVNVPLVMSQPGLWSISMHFQVLISTSSMSRKSMKSYWQAFSYAGDYIHEAFFHLGSVPLESTVADALELYICKLSWPLGSRLWCLTVSLLLSHWYPGSGVVLDCIDSWSLQSFLLCISQ